MCIQIFIVTLSFTLDYSLEPPLDPQNEYAFICAPRVLRFSCTLAQINKKKTQYSMNFPQMSLSFDLVEIMCSLCTL